VGFIPSLKIGIIHPSFEILGGAETTTLHLLSMLKKTNHITTLYTVRPPNLQELKNFKIHKVAKNNLPLFWKYQRMKENQQIFHDSKFEDVLVISGGGLTLENTSVKKVILYCHSTFEAENQFVNKKVTGILGIYHKIIQDNIRKSFENMRSSKVILVANSNYTREEVYRLFQKDSRVAYPPVDIKKYSRWFDTPKKNLIITLSRFSPEKNLNFALDLLKSSNLFYELIGNAKFESQIKLYDYLSASVKNSKNILLRPNLSSEDIEQSLSSSKVYLQPSKETFGISVIEAISAGCIPIVPDNSAFIETVPFDVLRFKEKEDAIVKLEDAMNGKYDYLRPILRKHIEKFSIENFQNSMLKEIESIN
jgi:glycosyltransferase involved in cell wall biosynthesis